MSQERIRLLREACGRAGIELVSPADIPNYRPPLRSELVDEEPEQPARRRACRPLKYDRAAIMQAILTKTKSMRQIADEFGCSRDVVRAVAVNSNLMHIFAPKPRVKKVRARKWTVRAGERAIKHDPTAIIEMSNRGMSSRSIAATLSIPPSTVRDIVRRHRTSSETKS